MHKINVVPCVSFTVTLYQPLSYFFQLHILYIMQEENIRISVPLQLHDLANDTVFLIHHITDNFIYSCCQFFTVFLDPCLF